MKEIKKDRVEAKRLAQLFFECCKKNEGFYYTPTMDEILRHAKQLFLDITSSNITELALKDLKELIKKK